MLTNSSPLARYIKYYTIPQQHTVCEYVVQSLPILQQKTNDYVDAVQTAYIPSKGRADAIEDAIYSCCTEVAMYASI